MRNLRLSSYFENDDKNQFSSGSALAIDPLTSSVFVLVNSTVVILLGDRLAQNVFLDVSDQILASDIVVAFDFLTDQMIICCCCHLGRIITIDPATKTTELVYFVHNGIETVAWSPNLELLAINDCNNRLLIMTREFIVISEIEGDPDTFGRDQLMTIGWGSKETQFQSSSARKKVEKFEKSENVVTQNGDHRSRIDWNGDGQYFAVNSLNGNCRKIRIWTKDGVLSSSCEQIAAQLGSCLAWKPSGNLIATEVLSGNNLHEIVFFERNGQRRSSFDLRRSEFQYTVIEKTENQTTIKLLWNADSTVLAIHTGNPGNNMDERVELWTVSNYHWHLKYTIGITPHFGPICAIFWDPNVSLDLHLLHFRGHYRRFSFHFTTDLSSSDSTIAVIDGNSVRMTAFEKAVIPPPMCKYEIYTPSAVNQIIWSLNGKLALLLDDFRLAICSKTDPMKIDQIINPDKEYSSIYNVSFLDENAFIAVSKSNDFSWSLVKISISNGIWAENTVLYRSEQSIIRQLCVSSGTFIQLFNGEWLGNLNRNAEFRHVLDSENRVIRFPTINCYESAVVFVDERPLIIGLSCNFQLFIDNRELSTNANSFSIHSDFLLVTTIDHRLHCLKWTDLLGSCVSNGNWSNGRSVERGSRLVSTSEKGTFAVLQLPRGNLETIHPRPLLLNAIKRLIDEGAFLDAMGVMKKHRINMNLLYDHNPELFVSQVDALIEQVSLNTSLLNLFLMDLSSENTTNTMYSTEYLHSKNHLNIGYRNNLKNDQENKVDRVCNLIRSAIDKQSYNSVHPFQTIILTSYLKMTHPQVESALFKVIEFADQASDNCEARLITDEALRLILCMVDSEKLFNIALGTYNFELMLLVAERSQKVTGMGINSVVRCTALSCLSFRDPKEYLPLLNALRRLEPYYMKYTIEIRLERFERAVDHMVQCSDEHFTECVQVVEKRRLFKKALTVFTDPPRHQTIALLYGNYLHAKRNFSESILWYDRGGALRKAFNSAKNGLLWRQMIRFGRLLEMDREKITDSLLETAEKLQSAGRFAEAAELYSTDLKLMDKALACYCKANDWSKAEQVVQQSSRSVLFEKLLERSEELLTNSDKWMHDLRNYSQRLEIVRKVKMDRIGRWQESGEPDFPESEVYSESASSSISSSNRSNLSTYSITPRKQREKRRKNDRKKSSLKEGGKYEDLALMGVIKGIIENVDALQDELESFFLVLLRSNFDNLACKVAKNLQMLISENRSVLERVWPPFLRANLIPGPLEELYKNEDGQVNFPIGNFMPEYIEIEPQMIAPKLRTNIHWMLDTFRFDS